MKRAANLFLILLTLFFLSAGIAFTRDRSEYPKTTSDTTALFTTFFTAQATPIFNGSNVTQFPFLSANRSSASENILPPVFATVSAPCAVIGSNFFETDSAPRSVIGSNFSKTISAPRSVIGSNFFETDSAPRSVIGSNFSKTVSLFNEGLCDSVSATVPTPHFLTRGNVSAAISTPHVVIGDNIWLLNGDGEKLFLLPKTYYAEITSLDETYYFVTFNGISGKVPKNSVRSVGYHTQASGTSESLKIDDAFAEFTRLSLKERPDRSSKTVSEMPTKDSFTFVGLYPKEEEVWYAVRYNEFFGYLRATLTSKKEMTFPDFVPEVEPPDDNAATTDPVPGDNSDSENGKEGFNPLTIVLVVGLTLPAIFIIILLFRKDSKKPKRFD